MYPNTSKKFIFFFSHTNSLMSGVYFKLTKISILTSHLAHARKPHVAKRLVYWTAQV